MHAVNRCRRAHRVARIDRAATAAAWSLPAPNPTLLGSQLAPSEIFCRNLRKKLSVETVIAAVNIGP